MWDCWINNIYLFYLIPHSSHILQPLDLSCFSPLKCRYRSKIEELARIDNAAPVKKRRFLQYYEKARNEGLTCSNICSGWKKAGILPWNPRRVIQSIEYPTQATSQPQTLGKRGSHTAKEEESSSQLTTPQNRRDFDRYWQLVSQQQHLPRPIRRLLSKTAKSFDHFTWQTTQAAFQLQAKSQQRGAVRSEMTHERMNDGEGGGYLGVVKFSRC
jgi:hypothetical protein